MGILAKPLGWILSILYNLVGNYGLAIVILTLIIKGLLYPVYLKSIKSSSRMGELQPRVQQIQQKYANDKRKANEEVSKLYKEEGVSMYGGCLPMIIQMFVIMGLFTLLRNPLQYMGSENMLIAVHEPFLWIKDLAQPDMWILPIGAGVATYVSYGMNSSAQAMGGGAQGQSMNKAMKYFFPLMILWMARSYPAGLAIYWFISQIVQIFYNLGFAKMREKDKVLREERRLAKLNEGKKKVVRKIVSK